MGNIAHEIVTYGNKYETIGIATYGNTYETIEITTWKQAK